MGARNQTPELPKKRESIHSKPNLRRQYLKPKTKTGAGGTPQKAETNSAPWVHILETKESNRLSGTGREKN